MSIEAKLSPHPSARLTIAPTPIHLLPRLSSVLGRNIYVKREDLTGFALGGNKVRKLDYLIGDALARKADTLVTSGASSFSRNAAAAGRVFGLEVHVLILGTETEQNRYSQEHFQRSGAIVHYVREEEKESFPGRSQELLDELKRKGRAVYPLHPGGSDRIGALGYVNVFAEIDGYSAATGVHFHKLILPTGSAGTQAGLLLGQCLAGYETQIIGMAISQKTDVQRGRVLSLALETADMMNVSLDERRLMIDDRFMGAGYPVPSREAKAAVDLFYETEGLLLDEIYTGKAAAGLIWYSEQQLLEKDANVLFIHTGGNGGFYYDRDRHTAQ